MQRTARHTLKDLIVRALVAVVALQNFAYAIPAAQAEMVAAPQTGMVAHPMIAAGDYHSLALKSDGTVWAWGDNSSGQLGDGTNTEQHVPVQVHGALDVGYLTGVIAVAGGGLHSLALKSDGTVWAWGEGTIGALGNGANADTNVPVQVSSLTGVIGIAAGETFSVALKSDGTVRAWGGNLLGTLGNGASPTNSNVPVTVTGLSDVTAIASAGFHSIALKSDGSVWAWGRGTSGELGDNNATTSDTPVQVVDEAGGPGFLSGVKAISGGGDFSLAIKADGTVRAWGDNSDGALGNGGGPDSNYPVTVSSLTGATAVEGGDGTALSITADGTAQSWGRDDYGQLGNGGANTDTDTPGAVSGITNARAIAAGPYSLHYLALSSDGSVRSWGANFYGQLGDNTTNDSNVPLTVGINLYVSPNAVIAIATGNYHNVVIKADGTVWTWGNNADGELGNNTNTDSNVPVQVSGLTNVVAVAGALFHTVALKADGTVWAWGSDYSGQVGINSNSDSYDTPQQVHGALNIGNLTDIVAIAAGGESSYAIKSDGTAWAWGLNGFGQLGDGSGLESDVPVQVSGLTDVTAIDGGEAHGIAMLSDGSIWSWGQNNSGQLGDGNQPTYSLTPVSSSGFNNVRYIDAFSSASAVVQADGTAWTWGNTPAQTFSSVSGIVTVSEGDFHTLVLKDDGTVWAQDDNFYGELGDGTNTNSATPVQVHGAGDVGFLTDAKAVAGAGAHSVALLGDGSVWTWGDNFYGQLGDGTNIASNVPVCVDFGGCSAPPAGPSTTDNKVLMSRLQVSTPTDITVSFNLSNTISTDLVITFDSAFTSLSIAGAVASTPDAPGCITGITLTGPSEITATKSSCTGDIIISGITATTPGTPGLYTISWINDSPGFSLVAIVDSDQVTVNANVSPTITFDLNANADNSPDSAPYSVPLGPLTTGAVTHSDNGSIPSIWANLETNATSGAVVTVLSANAALASTAVPTDTIPNAAGPMAAATANYGLCVENVTGPTWTTGTFQASSPYDTGVCDPAGVTNDVKTLSNVSPTTILDTAGAAVVNGAAEILVNAAISTSTVAHSDYTDVLTFVATGTF